MNIVVIGLTLSSSWGNGHATTFRALLKAFAGLGHTATFLECDKEWFASHRDLPAPAFCQLELYRDAHDLRLRFHDAIRNADAVIVGSFVPEGVAVGHWVCDTARGVTAFYDIDTPVTLARLERGDFEYVSPDLIPRFDVYLSFSGGKSLDILINDWHARRAGALYCAVDTDLYHPEAVAPVHELGYMGTYSPDRQPTLEKLLLKSAEMYENEKIPGTFVVAGPGYPEAIAWPGNVERIDHLPPSEHRAFYLSQRFTLSVTRADMIALGHSPSVRLFEAAACGVPIITDVWPGLGELFPLGTAILPAETTDHALRYLREMNDGDRNSIGEAARAIVLAAHTAIHRARELEQWLLQK